MKGGGAMSEIWIQFFFTWGPTIIFLVGVLSAIFVGMIRGFRKSIILLLQAAIIFSICLVCYLIIVNNDKTDTWVVSIINNFGGAGFLQRTLGVSEDCSSLTQMLIEFIPKNLSFGAGFELILKDNGAYLMTIVDLAYHIVFALVFYIIYILLEGFMYLIYLIFYPQRRHKKKIVEKYRKGKVDASYKKHFILGGVVGGLRGIFSGIIFFSFLGSILFMIAGTGQKKYNSFVEVDFNEDNALAFSDLDMVYDLYKGFESYGSTGIFKVLNMVKDSNDVPYYLYAADLVLQGGLKDETLGIDENIYLRKELGAYTTFAADTFDLVMKYGSKEITSFVNKTSDKNAILDVIIEVMRKDGFQEEFKILIDEFDSQTYFISLSLSFLNSIAKNIDSDITFITGIDASTKQLIKILFADKDGIMVSELLTREDINQLVKASLSLLSVQPNTDSSMDSTKVTLRNVLAYGNVVLPEIFKLSIFNNESNHKKLNHVLRNLYDYYANALVESMVEEGHTISSIDGTITDRALKLTNSSIDDIDWVEELKKLLNMALSAVELYDKIYDGNKDIATSLFEMFSDDNENKVKDEALFDEVVDNLGSSRLLGAILSIESIQNQMYAIIYTIVPSATLPSTLSFANEYDKNGEIIKYGEIYSFLNVIKLIAKSKDVQDVLNNLNSTDLASIQTLCDVLNKSTQGTSLLNQILKSEIMHYTISGMLLNMELNSSVKLSIYVPQESRIEGEDQIQLIAKEDLKDVFSALPRIINVIDTTGLKEADLVKNDNVYAAIEESKIVEGTISKLILDNLRNQDDVIIPVQLQNVDNWISTPEEQGEALKIIDAIRSLNLDISNMSISSLSIKEETTDQILPSQIMHYTVSKKIVDIFTTDNVSSIPKDAYDSTIIEHNVLLKEEISNLVTAMIYVLDSQDTGLALNDIQYDNLSITKNKLSYVYNSKIAYSKISSQITASFDGSPARAAYTSSDLTYLKESEINLLVDILGTESASGEIAIEVNSGESFSFNNLHESRFQKIKDSILVSFILSDIILNNGNIITPIKLTEYTYSDGDIYIVPSELSCFLDAFAGLYADAEGNIEITDNTEIDKMPAEEDFDLILESGIVRANITKNMTISTEEGTAASLVLYTEITDLDECSDEYTAVLTRDEIKRALTAFKRISANNNDSLNITLDLAQISQMDKRVIYEITSSNIIRLALNSIIESRPAYSYSILQTNTPYVWIAGLDAEVGIQENAVRYDLVANSNGLYGIPNSECTLINSELNGTVRIFNIQENKIESNKSGLHVKLENGTIVSTATQATLQAFFAILESYLNL